MLDHLGEPKRVFLCDLYHSIISNLDGADSTYAHVSTVPSCGNWPSNIYFDIPIALSPVVSIGFRETIYGKIQSIRYIASNSKIML